MGETLQEIADSLKPKVTPQPKTAFDELKETLESLRAVNPALVDSSRIFEHLLTLVDAREIVADQNEKLEALTFEIDNLKQCNQTLKRSIDDLTVSNRALKDEVSRNDAYMFQFKERAATALVAIEAYLRKQK